MKEIFKFNILIILCLLISLLIPSQAKLVSAEKFQETKPMLAIIIDDFGSYDQSGVETMLSIDAPITCAIMPNVDNTDINTKQALDTGKEVIVHMPMQACVNLPQNWYGPNHISNNDNKEAVYKKLNQAFESVKGAVGFNIHIGSGVCQYTDVVSSIYDYSIEKNKYFVDSRTHINTVCDRVAQSKNTVYLGRDEFLEPHGVKSYEGAKQHLLIGAKLAKDRGYAIVIGHVGTHGGESTARAIKDSIDDIKNMGVEIVPLSELYKTLNTTNVSKQ